MIPFLNTTSGCTSWCWLGEIEKLNMSTYRLICLYSNLNDLGKPKFSPSQVKFTAGSTKTFLIDICGHVCGASVHKNNCCFFWSLGYSVLPIILTVYECGM